jgi:hypothetical protein
MLPGLIIGNAEQDVRPGGMLCRISAVNQRKQGSPEKSCAGGLEKVSSFHEIF